MNREDESVKNKPKFGSDFQLLHCECCCALATVAAARLVWCTWQEGARGVVARWPVVVDDMSVFSATMRSGIYMHAGA